MMWIIIIVALLVLILIGVKLFKVLPQFGAKPTGESNERIQKSKNFKNGKFRNLEDKAMMTKKFDFTAIIKYFSNGKDKIPKVSLPVERVDINSFKGTHEKDIKLIWFGHSTVLLEVDSKKILLDPMLSEAPAPHTIVVPKRFSRRIPLEIIDFPELDAVLISHDHYDHLDYISIIELKDRVKMFYVPLGVGAHLKSWGVEPSKIIELDWWQESKLEGLTFIATPSHHFSGRGLFNGDSTL